MRTVSGLLLFMFIAGLVWAQAPKSCGGIDALIGEWTGAGKGAPGEGNGGFTFQRDLQGKVTVRKNFAEYPATKDRPAYRHDDLMVIYEDSSKVRRADYWDNEGHVIRYAIAVSPDRCIVTGYNGAGQSIALVEGYGYPTLEKDANAFSALAGLPKFTSTNFQMVYPEGKPNPELGVIEGWNIEIALDIDWSHTIAPGAKIVEVITSGQDNEDFQYSINYVAENNLANSVSNSYEEDLDLIAGPEEQISWDDTLEVATAKGISVNFSSGDGGDNGVGSPVGAPLVPSVAPHATAVGGTSIFSDPKHSGSTITTAWGDTLTFLESSGSVVDPPVPDGVIGLIFGGGGGESTFWTKPSWQSALPGKGREVPDVSALSDPYTGVPIVITIGTTQEIQYGWGGTSLGCPIFSAFWALANQKAGAPLGQAAPLIAGLPYGSIQDVLPTSDSSPYNVHGSVTDSSGTTAYTAAELFGTALYGNKGFTSGIWEEDPDDFIDFGFGIDSSLTVKKGWDNATGFGTPYGMTFLNAVAP